MQQLLLESHNTTHCLFIAHALYKLSFFLFVCCFVMFSVFCRVMKKECLAHTTSFGVQGVCMKWEEWIRHMPLDWLSLWQCLSGLVFVRSLYIPPSAEHRHWLCRQRGLAAHVATIRFQATATYVAGSAHTVAFILCNCSVALYYKRRTIRGGMTQISPPQQPLWLHSLRAHNSSVCAPSPTDIHESFRRAGWWKETVCKVQSDRPRLRSLPWREGL